VVGYEGVVVEGKDGRSGMLGGAWVIHGIKQIDRAIRVSPTPAESAPGKTVAGVGGGQEGWRVGCARDCGRGRDEFDGR
jgi:hypothetical protein